MTTHTDTQTKPTNMEVFNYLTEKFEDADLAGRMTAELENYFDERMISLGWANQWEQVYLAADWSRETAVGGSSRLRVVTSPCGTEVAYWLDGETHVLRFNNEKHALLYLKVFGEVVDELLEATTPEHRVPVAA